jgi:hypothetical protein
MFGEDDEVPLRVSDTGFSVILFFSHQPLISSFVYVEVS